MSGSKGKVFGTIWRVTRCSPWTHITLAGYPGQNESCPPRECRWNVLDGYALKDTHMNELKRKKDTSVNEVAEKILKGDALKDTRVTEESLEGYM